MLHMKSEKESQFPFNEFYWYDFFYAGRKWARHFKFKNYLSFTRKQNVHI